jgi:uncharacterized Ntn-hydrolase superfamily protein
MDELNKRNKRFEPRFPLAHTFSIVARDAESGEMGVAVQSHWFSVGSVVAWGEAGVGVVATQAMVEMSYGPKGVALMREGVPAPAALQALLEADEGSNRRQVAFIDSVNRVATHTGTRCIAEAGHVSGDGFSVQANMMKYDTVWPAMAKAYRETKGELSERMLAAMDAAQTCSGDIRGQQSAAILIVRGKPTGSIADDQIMDLRVEDNPRPLVELRRLLNIQRAYTLMNQGDAYLGAGDVPAALKAYSTAAGMAPDMVELPFWHAVTLADLGRVDESLPIFKSVFAVNPDWALLLQRLPPAGLMREDAAVMEKILSVSK